MGRELHSIRDGQRADAHLHEPILNQPVSHLRTQARAVRRAIEGGLTYERAMNLYGHDLRRRPPEVADAQRMQVPQRANQGPNSEWFSALSPEQQDEYLKEHPRSTQHRDARARPQKPKASPEQPAPQQRDVPQDAGGGRKADPAPMVAPRAQPAQRETEAPTPDSGGAASHLQAADADRERWPEHIKALALPPAWTDVRLSHDPAADLQAIGKDAKGRAQYVYSEAFARSQAAAKFARIQDLHGQSKAIAKQVQGDMGSDDPRRAEVAQCMHLVMSMGLRPGSDADTGADKQAYGATTLRGSHVVTGVDGRTRLQFVGKKGVDLDLAVPDARTARMLGDLAKRAGPDGALFPQTNEKALLDYAHSLGNGGFKTKDFRTLRGTTEAHRRVADMEPPTDEKSYRKAVRDVAVHVSRALGNTPSVALASYICPSAFAPWQHAAPSARQDRVETAMTTRPPRSKLPLVHYGRVGDKSARHIPLHDERDDDRMPRRIPSSTLRLLGLDPRKPLK